MAIELPANPHDISRLDWGIIQPIRSGDTAADKAFGLEGVIENANWTKANNVYVLDRSRHWNAGLVWDTTNSASFDTGRRVDVEVSTHIVEVTLTARIKNGYIGIEELGAGQTSSTLQGATEGTKTVSRTLSATGVIGLRVLLKADSGQTAECWGWVLIEERLVAGDFSWY